jgi:aryl-alcohol dehydrogenase-like predicted oxidoreductase
MPYRQLGKSPLKVSTLCLGTMMFGDQTTLNEAASIVADAREHGVNYIDTSDNYSKGGSETMVGQLLKGQRQDWVLAKPGHPSTPGYTDPNYPPTGRFRTV